MKWLIFAIFSAFLTACSVSKNQFSLPDHVFFQGKNFVRVTSNQIDEMQHLLYLPEQSSHNPDNWQQGILFFLDKKTDKSLNERVALRQKAFATQQNVKAQIAVQNNELHSEILYPPTERFNDIQLEVSRGRNLQCGYGQIQFADKRSISDKNLRVPSAYHQELVQLALQFSQLPWQIECQ